MKRLFKYLQDKRNRFLARKDLMKSLIRNVSLLEEENEKFKNIIKDYERKWSDSYNTCYVPIDNFMRGRSANFSLRYANYINNVEKLTEPGRKVGNTTRLIDFSIQWLFKVGNIPLKAIPSYDGLDKKILLDNIDRRLNMEHGKSLKLLNGELSTTKVNNKTNKIGTVEDKHLNKWIFIACLDDKKDEGFPFFKREIIKANDKDEAYDVGESTLLDTWLKEGNYSVINFLVIPVEEIINS